MKTRLYDGINDVLVQLKLSATFVEHPVEEELPNLAILHMPHVRGLLNEASILTERALVRLRTVLDPAIHLES